MVRPSIRGGVPVFNRPCGSASSFSRRASDHHDRAGAEPDARLRHRADHALALPGRFDHQVIDRLLEQPQIRLVFEPGADGLLVEQTIGLRAGGAHCGAFGTVEDAELDAGFVGGGGHRTAKRVDLLD